MLWERAELSSPDEFQQVRHEAACPQRLPRQFWCLICPFLYGTFTELGEATGLGQNTRLKVTCSTLCTCVPLVAL